MAQPRATLLTFEEIRRVVEVFTELGVDKVRLTGGEPLLRRDVADLVAHAGVDGGRSRPGDDDQRRAPRGRRRRRSGQPGSTASR